jgi:hypothetical protein
MHSKSQSHRTDLVSSYEIYDVSAFQYGASQSHLPDLVSSYIKAWKVQASACPAP